MKIQKSKQSWAERIKKRNKLGFSLVELVVVIAILAIMTAVLAPSLLSYVERSRAQKDTSAMSEVVNSIMLALADQNVYDEVLCYTAADNKSCYVDSLATYDASHSSYSPTKKDGETVLQYMFNDDARREDENPYAPAGVMRGVTITFEPEQSTNKSCYVLYNGIINKFGPTDFIYGSMPNTESNDDDELLLGGMASFGSPTHHYLYNRVRSTVGDKIELTSQTYRNSEYTVFIRMGTTGGGQADKQDAIAVYGQWNGTNLSYGNSGTPNGGANGSSEVEVKTGGASAYSWAELKLIAQSDKPLSYYHINIGDQISDGTYTYVLVDDARDTHYGGLVFMFNASVDNNGKITNTYYMNYASTNYGGFNDGGFAASDMLDYLNNTERDDAIIKNLSVDMVKAIKDVDVMCNDGNANYQKTWTAEDVKLFLPSVREVGFETTGYSWYANYEEFLNKECIPDGGAYDYNKAVFEWFKTDGLTNRINISTNFDNNNSASIWWLRSAIGRVCDGFWSVHSDGALYTSNAGSSCAVVPAFVVG